MNNGKGTLIISLDFELHWGVFDKRPIEQWKLYFDQTRALIPELLSLFQEYEVRATWATVGLLMHSDLYDLYEGMPEEVPTYERGEYSAYEYIKSEWGDLDDKDDLDERDDLGDQGDLDEGSGVRLRDETTDPYHFAASLVERIRDTPGQEIGTHTFGHYYCNEKGQTPEQFRADLKAAKKAAGKMGIELRSLVFPRNQFNGTYLAICRDEGIRSVRSNPDLWYWNIDTADEPIMKRLVRGYDAYRPLGLGKNRFRIEDIDNATLPLQIPASRLLRAWSPKERFLHSWKASLIRREMAAAAREGSVYHLWWHPHNFGHCPAENLAFLRELLEHARTLGMSSLSMGDLTEKILDGRTA